MHGQQNIKKMLQKGK